MRPLSRGMFLGAIVAALLASWVVVSCSSSPPRVALSEETAEEWYALVDETISEPQRAERVRELGKQLIDLTHSIQEDVKAMSGQAMELNAEYGATEADLEALIDTFAEKRSPKLQRYKDLIFALRAEVSEDEWEALLD